VADIRKWLNTEAQSEQRDGIGVDLQVRRKRRAQRPGWRRGGFGKRWGVKDAFAE